MNSHGSFDSPELVESEIKSSDFEGFGVRMIVCSMDIHVRRMAMKHFRSQGYCGLTAVRQSPTSGDS